MNDAGKSLELRMAEVEPVQTLTATLAAPCQDPQRAILQLLHAPILRLLAEGRPASADELTTLVGRPAREIAAMTERLPLAELDPQGRVLGLGLSLIPTPHRVELVGRGHALYAWCAPEALLLPGVIGLPARIASPCRATGEMVTLEVHGGRVRGLRPPSAVVSFVTSPDRADLRATGCDQQNFFVSAEAASSWLEAHPGSTVLPVEEALRLLRHLREGCT